MLESFEIIEESIFSKYLIDRLPNTVFCLGGDASFLYLNDAACRQLEYSRQELLSMKLSDIDPYFSQKAWLEQWKSLKQRNSSIIKSKHRTRSGQFLPVELTLTYVKEQNRDFICVFVRRVEETQPTQNANSSERTLFDDDLRGCAAAQTKDLSACNARIDSSAEPKAQSVARTGGEASSVCEADDGASAPYLGAHALHGSQTRTDKPHKGDSVRRMYDNGLSRNGSINNSYQEISQSEEKAQLAKSLSLVRGTLDSTAYGTVAVNYKGEVLSRNQKFLEMWKIPDSLVLSKDSQECQNFFARQLKNPEVFRNSVWEISRKSEAETCDILELKDGRMFAQYSRPQRLDDEIIGRVWSIWDITELRQQTESELQKTQGEIEIVQAVEEAKQLSELRSRFLSLLCHQFRSSLNIISFANSLLKRHANKHTDNRKLLYFDNIQTAIEQISVLLDELVFFGKSEVGQIDFEPKPTDLANFCRILVAQMQPLLDSKQQTIKFSSSRNCNIVCVDKNILHHILTNLLSNAIKYSPDGHEVKFEILGEQDRVIIKIQDRGIGISEVDQQRLFDPFVRGSNVDSIPGNGLGLSIVKNLVEIHDGKIEVESKVGIGTSFYVVFQNYGNSV